MVYDAQAAWSNDWTDPASSDGHPPAEQLAGLQPAELDHESIREALQVSRWLKQRSIGCATKMNWQKAQRLLRRCDVTVVFGQVKSAGKDAGFVAVRVTLLPAVRKKVVRSLACLLRAMGSLGCHGFPQGFWKAPQR